MHKTTLIVIIVIIVIIWCLGIAPLVYSESITKPGFVSGRIQRHLNLSQSLLKQNQAQVAVKKLNLLLGNSRLNHYEQALIYQMLGYAYTQQSGTYTQAATAFANSIEQNSLPNATQQAMRYNLAQLYLATEQYAASIRTLTEWITLAKNVKAADYVMLANAYYHQKDFIHAKQSLQQAFDLNHKAPKVWYQLMMALLFELKDYQTTILWLEKAVKVFPNDKDMWRQLASAYQQTGAEHQALATLALAHEKKLLDATEIVYLARMYYFLNTPFQCANLLTQAIQTNTIPETPENLTLSAECWFAAKELDKAANTFIQAATLTSNGNLSIRAGEIYLEQGQWQLASHTFQQGIDKGEIDKPGQALLNLGIAQFEANHYQQAKSSFTKALKYKASKKNARIWLQQIREFL